ncbi:hypothetical protein DVK52_26215 [Escherichia coli]|nr:hypothetical protein [Escherichia coli]EGD8093450.1 hypothetical protein [Escherichia coli]
MNISKTGNYTILITVSFNSTVDEPFRPVVITFAPLQTETRAYPCMTSTSSFICLVLSYSET